MLYSIQPSGSSRWSHQEVALAAEGRTRFAGFDDKVLSLYARGMTTREIQGHLEEMYGVEVSPALISNVTDAAIDKGMAGPWLLT